MTIQSKLHRALVEYETSFLMHLGSYRLLYDVNFNTLTAGLRTYCTWISA